MYPVIGIVSLSCLLLIFTVLKSPVLKFGRYHIKIFYWVSPLIGAIVLIITGLLPISTVIAGLTKSDSINPLKILILFISMTILSIFLDEAGLFSYLASLAITKASSSQKRLFLILFVMVSVLTVFTSNDIIILTFTPFICYFSKRAQINPIPYLFGEFVAANTWSMLLIIGNPTNIYLATAAGITFGRYTLIMLLPTILAGITALLMLLLIFNKSLSEPMTLSSDVPALKDKGMIIIGVIHLAICTILLVISSYVGLEMWYITLAFAISLFICITIYKKIRRSKEHILLHTFTRAPWELIPFVLSMFLLVLGLERYEVTLRICSLLGDNFLIAKYGFLSFLTANIMNNIPMAVAFSSITLNLPDGNMLPATFASIIGSNIGAYFTPLGALAGIMWTGILGRMEIKLSFGKYFSYGSRIAIPVMCAALAGLYLSLIIF